MHRKQQELGEAALQLARDGKLSEPTLDPLVASIEEQDKHLSELREQLVEVQGTTSQPTAPPTS